MAGPGAPPRIMMLSLILLIFVGLVSAQNGKASKSMPKCCNTQLMDSPGFVIIEGYERLTPNRTIRAILSTICAINVDFFVAQVWRRIPGTDENPKYNLHWHETFTTTPNVAGEEEKEVYALTEPFEIGADDYLGFWAKEASRLPVPFGFDGNDLSYTFYLSDERFTDPAEFDAVDLELSHRTNLRWPRSMKEFFKFCEDIDCADQDVDIIQIEGPVGPPGPAGPPGPPGQAGENGIGIIGNDDVPGGGIFSCAVPKVEEEVIDAQIKISKLSNQVSQMQQALNAIYNSNSVTGICPTGMLAGTYGVGSCYIFRRELASMAVAELRCRQDFDAHLVSIESEIEERFLRNEVLKSGNSSRVITGNEIEAFWTAAMYNKPRKQWVWYHESRKSQPVLQYTNWKTKAAPTPSGDQDICTTLNVDIRTTTSDWNLINCNKRRFYMCEVSKKCL